MGNLRVIGVMRGCYGEFEGNRSDEGVSWQASFLEFTLQQQKTKLKTKVILNFFQANNVISITHSSSLHLCGHRPQGIY